MGRKSKPYFSASKGAWFATIQGRRRRLAVGKDARKDAEIEHRRLMHEADRGRAGAGGLTVGELVAAYLTRMDRRVEAGEIGPTTYGDADRRLSRFVGHFGRTGADRLTPGAVEDWLGEQSDWGPTTRHDTAGAIRAVFRWARRGKRIAGDPLEGLEKPQRTRRREVVMGADLWPVVRSAIVSWEFLFLAEFLHGTGCRPGEAFKLEARHVDWDRGIAVVPGKQTRKTGRASVIAMSEDVLGWLLPLCEARPIGPVFRTAKGNPWSKNSVNCQVRDLRKRIGVGKDAGVVAYALRHLFATDMLDRGTPVATVSTLLNHGDTRMVMQHYSHLADRHEHLRAAVEDVRPARDGGSSRAARRSPSSGREQDGGAGAG